MGIDPAFLNEWRNFFKGVVFKDTNVFNCRFDSQLRIRSISLLGREGAIAPASSVVVLNLL